MAFDRISHLGFVVLLSVALLGTACKDDGPYTIRGTARLPDCVESDAAPLDGSHWFDFDGVVTIESAGCEPAAVMDMFDSCALEWVMSHKGGGDVEIIVDSEYRILGRVCGTDLHLEGGWWLPVEDEGVCTYDEDSAEEVGIDQAGNVLSLSLQPGTALLQAEGILALGGPCDASYDVTLTQTR